MVFNLFEVRENCYYPRGKKNFKKNLGYNYHFNKMSISDKCLSRLIWLHEIIALSAGPHISYSICKWVLITSVTSHARIQMGEGQGVRPPEKKYRVSLQYWSGSPENHKAFRPAFNVGPSSARQRNAKKGTETASAKF